MRKTVASITLEHQHLLTRVVCLEAWIFTKHITNVLAYAGQGGKVWLELK